MKKWMTTLFLSLILMTAALPAFALPPRMVKALGLSAQQEAAIEKIQLNFKRKALTLRYKLQLARLDLRVLLKPHRPNMKKVIPAIEKVGQLEVQFKKIRILRGLRIRSVLTPAQAQKAKEFRRRRRMMRRRRWGRRGRRWGRRGRRWNRRHHRRHMRQNRGGMEPAPAAPPKGPKGDK